METINIYENKLLEDPFFYIHWANLATLEWDNGDFDGAIKDMEKAVGIAPMSDMVWLNLGYMEEALGNSFRAEESYTNAICLNPLNIASAPIKASPLFDAVVKHECPTAILEFNSRDFIRDLARNGVRQYMLGDYDSAREYFLEVTQKKSSDLLANAFLSQIYYEYDNIEESLEHLTITEYGLETSQGKSSSLAMAHLLVGELYYTLGDNALAMEHIRASYDMFAQQNILPWYYAEAYRFASFPQNVSPYLYTSYVNNTQLNLYKYLAVHLELGGETSKANEIRRWIDWNTPPLGFDE